MSPFKETVSWDFLPLCFLAQKTLPGPQGQMNRLKRFHELSRFIIGFLFFKSIIIYLGVSIINNYMDIVLALSISRLTLCPRSLWPCWHGVRIVDDYWHRTHYAGQKDLAQGAITQWPRTQSSNVSNMLMALTMQTPCERSQCVNSEYLSKNNKCKIVLAILCGTQVEFFFLQKRAESLIRFFY